MAWIHANASICFGIGINPEIDSKKVSFQFKPPLLNLNKVPNSQPALNSTYEAADDLSIESTLEIEEEEAVVEEGVNEVIKRICRINRERTESESRNDLSKPLGSP